MVKYRLNQSRENRIMPRMRLLPATAAAVSNPFSVHSGESLAVVASGLAGAETAVVQIFNGSEFVDLTESAATITATSLTTSISSVGLYRIRKSATVASSGVVVG